MNTKNLIQLCVVMILISIVLIVGIKNDFVLDNTTAQNIAGNILYVGGSGPNNYTKIQDAINVAVDGDTIFVYADSSPYYENIVIDKKVNIIGENRNTTIIDGNGKEVVNITSSSIEIRGFTIRNAGLSPYAGIRIDSSYNKIYDCNIFSNGYCGIFLHSGNENNISDCDISDNLNGVFLYYECYNNIIHNCKLTSNGGDGIILGYRTSNTNISNCKVSFNDNGISISSDSASNNYIYNCNIKSNNKGIFAYDSANNISIIKCNISSNVEHGIHFFSVNDSSISHCNITYNGGNGIEIGDHSFRHEIYYCNISHNNIGLLMWESFNNTLQNNDIISNNGDGICLRITDANIKNCNISGNSNGIHMENISEKCTILGCNIYSNKLNGIDSGYIFEKCEFLKCNIYDNGKDGIHFKGSASCYSPYDAKITNCNISYNKRNGTWFYRVYNLKISNSILHSNNLYGIYTSCRTNVSIISANISNCKIINNGLDGAHLDDVFNASIKGSNISSNNGNGTWFIGYSFKIYDSVIYFNNLIGINYQYTLNSSFDSIISNCNVTHNGGIGIFGFHIQDIEVNRCKIKFNADDGIFFNIAQNITLKECESTHNNLGGIRLFRIHNLNISNCNISYNEEGTSLQYAHDINLNGCIISHNNLSGVRLNNLGNTEIYDSEICFNNGGDGVSVNDGENLEIYDSKVCSNGVYNSSGAGIDISLLNTTIISRCNISSNGRNGVFSYGISFIEISNCSTLYNFGNGLEIILSDIFKIYNSDICFSGISTHNLSGIRIISVNTTIISKCNISSNGRDGIYSYSASYIKVDNCSILYNFYNGVDITSTSSFRMCGCKIHHNKKWGIVSDANTTISNCKVFNNEEGIIIHYSNSTKINNCNIYNNRDGIFLYHASNINIHDCNIYQNSEGINIQYTENAEIFDCNISYNEFGIGLNMYEHKNIIIHHCEIKNNNGSGIVGNDITDSIITNNDISSNGSNDRSISHYIYSSSNILITNNTFEYGGLLIRGSDLKIDNCTVNSGSIEINGSDFKIDNCTVNSGSIDIRSGSDFKMSECTVNSGNIAINGSDFKVCNCTTKLGVFYVGDGDNFKIDNCTVNSGSIDIRSGSDFKIYNCKTKLNPVGINVQKSSNFTIEKCIVTESNYSGIYIRESNDFLISNSTIINQSSRGVHLCRLHDGKLKNCNISKNKGDGITMEGGYNVEICNCNIEDNTGSGIFAREWPYLLPGPMPIHDIKINNCIIKGSNYGGLELHSSNNTIISNCEIYENNEPAIYYRSSDNVSVTNCNIHNNNYSGIHVWKSTNSLLKDNVIRNNIFPGIWIISSNYVVISNNTVNSNGHGIMLYDASSHCNIHDCNIYDNGWGVFIESDDCTDNTIYHNSFRENEKGNAYDGGSNIWDNGYPSGGNYWDDYTGDDADNDGVGDTPYKIRDEKKDIFDRYPLMYPNGSIEIETSGIFRLKIAIKNTADINIPNIKWSIKSSGLAIIFGQKEGIINLPSEGEIKINRFIFGIGPANMVIKAGRSEETISAFVIGPLILMRS